MDHSRGPRSHEELEDGRRADARRSPTKTALRVAFDASCLRRSRLLAAAIAALALSLAPLHAREDDPRTAADAIRAAMAERLGGDVEVAIAAIDVENDAPVFREARPDPSARLGKPMRFTLVTVEGDAILTTATLTITADQVIAKRAISRGATVTSDDVASVRGVLQGVPIKPLPSIAQVVGAKALRPIAAGAIVLPGFVLAPRAVEPGDTVTVTAAAGPVQVTASMIAIDGGRIGDTIRIRHPESKSFLRGRIVGPGQLEVRNER
jgi:flagella basal body P-ring formation protein FlgA